VRPRAAKEELPAKPDQWVREGQGAAPEAAEAAYPGLPSASRPALVIPRAHGVTTSPPRKDRYFLVLSSFNLQCHAKDRSNSGLLAILARLLHALRKPP